MDTGIQAIRQLLAVLFDIPPLAQERIAQWNTARRKHHDEMASRETMVDVLRQSTNE
jgi:hypothetical protein